MRKFRAINGRMNHGGIGSWKTCQPWILIPVSFYGQEFECNFIRKLLMVYKVSLAELQCKTSNIFSYWNV